MKPSDQNRNRGVRNYAGTGVTIFIVTLIGTSVGLLAGLYIARTAENNHQGLVDAFTVAAEVMVAVGSVTLVWFFCGKGRSLQKPCDHRLIRRLTSGFWIFRRRCLKVVKIAIGIASLPQMNSHFRVIPELI